MLERDIFVHCPRGVMARSERTPHFSTRAFAARSLPSCASGGRRHAASLIVARSTACAQGWQRRIFRAGGCKATETPRRRSLTSQSRSCATRSARRALLSARHDSPLLRRSRHHAQKKTARASEQDQPDVLKRRQTWFESQLDLDPERLVFIDETWASTNMARTHSRCRRCRRGERLRVGVPHGHWKTTTFVAALTTRGMVAPFVLDGPINRPAFGTYVERVLAPELRQGEVVVMDNLSSGAVKCSRGPKRQAPVFCIFRPIAGLQSDRGRLRQAQSPAAQSCRANRRRSLDRHRTHRRSSPLTNVETTSPPQDTMQRDRLSLVL